MIAREELIGMLSQIYDKLDEAEQLLESNISSKENWQLHYSAKLISINERISAFEIEKFLLTEFNVAENNEKRLEPPKGMKLKLGF